MKCVECNGSGSVNPTMSYREPAEVLKEEEPVQTEEPREFVLMPLFRWVKECWLPISFVAAAGVGIVWFGMAVNRRMDWLDARDAKKGFVVAQYDQQGKVLRCWVSHFKSDIELTGISASAPVEDMADVNAQAHKLGIEDPKQCIR